MGDDIVEEERGDSSHTSAPDDEVFVVFDLIKISEESLDVLLFSKAIGSKLAFAFSTAGEVKGEKGVLFGEMGEDGESLHSVTAKSVEIEDAFLLRVRLIF